MACEQGRIPEQVVAVLAVAEIGVAQVGACAPQLVSSALCHHTVCQAQLRVRAAGHATQARANKACNKAYHL